MKMQTQERNGLSVPVAVVNPAAGPRSERLVRDYDQIAAMQARNGLSPRPKWQWTALWQGNPVYEQDRNGWPIGWVLGTRPWPDRGIDRQHSQRLPVEREAHSRRNGVRLGRGSRVPAFSLLLMQRMANQPNADPC